MSSAPSSSSIMWTLAVVLACVTLAASATAASASGIATPSYCGDTPNSIPPLPEGTEATLVQVQVYARHGDRTPAFDSVCWVNNTAVWHCNLTQLQSNSVHLDAPVTTLPRVFRHRFMPNVEVLQGDCGLGQLTQKGYMQHIDNGQALRAAYVDRAGLLPASYLDEPDQFHLRSDNARRTDQSGQALFTGLYPPESDALASPEAASDPSSRIVNWWIMDEDTDTITTNPTRCPALNTLSAAATASPAYMAHIKQVTEPLDKKLSQVFGVPVNTGWNNTGINLKLDCIMTHKCHDFALPPGVDQDLFDAIVNEVTYEYNYELLWPNYARLAFGAAMRELYANMQAVMGKSTAPAKKFWLFVGHDEGPIQPMLASLVKGYDLSFPWCSYASMISMELYSVPSSVSAAGYAVRMVYNGKVITMAGCSDTLCAWEEFEVTAQKMIPDPSECQPSGGKA